MRLSKQFTKTRKTVPADETSRNAQLLIQAGYIHKELAGVYAYLPFGIQVLENIKSIVREEMNSLGSQELIMTSLQRKELWEKTDRWGDENVDIWFKTKLKNGSDVGLAWSHEEPMVDMMKNFVSSYRELPVAVYQFQTKFRNELRAKSGIMRGREFVMKDLYGFSRNDQELLEFYDKVKRAYLNIFERVGLGDITYITYASGGAFTKFSHEFQTVTDAGEDVIYISKDKKLAINEEVYNEESLSQIGLTKEELEKVKSAEVGNIFNFGPTKAEELGMHFTDESGKDKPVYLSSYGIGITRLMGVIAEHFSDDKGLVWPENIAPAKVYIARLGDGEQVTNQADELYNLLKDSKVTVIYDDRDVRAGEKFADADLLGIPYRIVISDKTVESGTIELKYRKESDSKQIQKDELLKMLGIVG
ncbi:MAG: proline--tRNA ligase [Candidatus Saccharimonadales bacterium]